MPNIISVCIDFVFIIIVITFIVIILILVIHILLTLINIHTTYAILPRHPCVTYDMSRVVCGGNAVVVATGVP